MICDHFKQHAFFTNRPVTCGSYLKEIYFTSSVCLQFEVHTLRGVTS